MTRLFFSHTKIVKVNRAFYHYVQYNTQAITKTKGEMQFWDLLDKFLVKHNCFKEYKEVVGLSKIKD